MIGEPPTARATFAEKFWTTRLVILCDSGVFSPTVFMTAPTWLMRAWASVALLAFAMEAEANGGGDLMRLRSWDAEILGSGAAIMALTIATPSRAFLGWADW